MNAGIDLHRPRAAACPNCGQPAVLPRVAPETLYFAAFQRPAPRRGLDLADGTVIVLFSDRIYAMSSEEWAHYEVMMASA